MDLPKDEEARRAAYFAADEATQEKMREAYQEQTAIELAQARQEFLTDTPAVLMPKDVYDNTVGEAWKQPTPEAAQALLHEAGIDVDFIGDHR